MPTIRSLIPKVDPPDELVKLQVWVSLHNKRTVLSAIGDDGIYTLIIATRLQQVADYIKKHDITSFDPESHAKLLDFICNGTDTRAVGHSAVRHDTGTAKSIQHPDASASSKSGGTSKGGAGGRGQQTGKGRK